jgi:hypothetical protein
MLGNFKPLLLSQIRAAGNTDRRFYEAARSQLDRLGSIRRELWMLKRLSRAHGRQMWPMLARICAREL